MNYKSAALTKQAVQSVLDSESLGPMHVVVVDNSDDGDEAEKLRYGLPPGVALLLSHKNIGFGRACNLALERFEGQQILLINPDAQLLPGCLLRLQKTLFSSKRVGAVSPQIFWDDGLNFYIPPPVPLSLFEFQDAFGMWAPGSPLSGFLSKIWRHYSIKIWRSRRPVRVINLSGGLVLLKRDAVFKTGLFFDPRFFLYFEDTDLFIRLRKAGYSLAIEPRAKAIHYGEQCGRSEWENKRMFMTRSHMLLAGKYGNGLKTCLRKMAGRLALPAIKRRVQFPQPHITSPFDMKVPGYLQKGWLFEASPNPNFIPSAGRFGYGELMDFSEKYWSMLVPGQYFGRLGSPVGCSKFSKIIKWIVKESI